MALRLTHEVTQLLKAWTSSEFSFFRGFFRGSECSTTRPFSIDCKKETIGTFPMVHQTLSDGRTLIVGILPMVGRW
jgi:hypothetical protein